MARDKHGRTLKAGDPVSLGDKHLLGTVVIAQPAQTGIKVDWTDKDAYPDTLEGAMVEYWGPEEQRLWAEARDADMPKGDPVVESPPTAPPAPPVEQPSQPAQKPHVVHAMTKRDAHKPKAR